MEQNKPWVATVGLRIFPLLIQIHHMFLRNLPSTCITSFSMKNVPNLYILLLGCLEQIKNVFDMINRSWKVKDLSGLIRWYLLEKGSDYLEIFLCPSNQQLKTTVSLLVMQCMPFFIFLPKCPLHIYGLHICKYLVTCYNMTYSCHKSL